MPAAFKKLHGSLGLGFHRLNLGVWKNDAGNILNTARFLLFLVDNLYFLSFHLRILISCWLFYLVAFIEAEVHCDRPTILFLVFPCAFHFGERSIDCSLVIQLAIQKVSVLA
jgi:hypothetical protein